MAKNKKLKIAIDVSPLSDGNAKRGVGIFTRQLVAALKKEISSNPEYSDFQINYIENWNLDFENYSLVHYPFFDPFFPTLPRRQNIPTIVTVYDLIPRQFKRHFPVGLKGELTWLGQKRRLKSSDYLLTCSHYSKYAIHQITRYPLDRIYVTPGAASDIFKPIKDTKKLKLIHQKYHLPPKFVFYVGDINWNKNIPSLVKACQQLKYPLVIAGAAAVSPNVPDHPWTADLHWLQNQQYPQLIGFVPDDDLPSIYNLATLYCQPSYAEGFGLTVLEAMKSGCPTAISRETSLPEITDQNALYFDPYRLDSIKKVLSQLWQSPSLRRQLSQKGIAHARKFSWQSTALQTLALYRLALLSHEK